MANVPQILPTIQSPRDLQALSDDQLLQLATEMRGALCDVVSDRSAHFASNLGVVELCIALHLVYDFSKDRIIWDTGHQIYPHKLVTGRYSQFHTIRQRHGLMGYPNPAESEYDLFVTGHAGASVSTALGLKAGDDLVHAGENRKSVAVIGDGAFPSGVVFEAMNNASGLDKDLLMILNDNKMGICPRVGGLAKYLDMARTKPFYDGLKRDIVGFVNMLPFGDSLDAMLRKGKDGLKALLHGGQLFEELGFKYVGPIDGHDLFQLRNYLEMVKEVKGPVLLHVITNKGQGFAPACDDPVKFHAPPPFQRNGFEEVTQIKSGSSRAYTDVVSEAMHAQMRQDEKVAVLTAAMCSGNKLGQIRDEFPDRFFDVGICEAHAVAFAGGMAKAGAKPIVAIYSTFLQRSFDHIFQEVALQNLPVTFCLDRGGLCGPDGPTHHGVFDISYMRIFPNMVVMAPGDETDVAPMLDFALNHTSPVSLRYPKTGAETVVRPRTPLEYGKAEVYEWGTDGTLLACGALFPTCVAAAQKLKEEGLEIGVINARFIKPLDNETILKAVEETGFVITVEENALAGGFGSAVLEMVNAAGARTDHIKTLGIPDRFIDHGERDELLAELGLDVAGIAQSAREMAGRKASIGR